MWVRRLTNAAQEVVDDVVNVVQQSFRHGRLIEIVRTFAFTGLEIIEYYFVDSSIGKHDDHVATSINLISLLAIE